MHEASKPEVQVFELKPACKERNDTPQRTSESLEFRCHLVKMSATTPVELDASAARRHVGEKRIDQRRQELCEVVSGGEWITNDAILSFSTHCGEAETACGRRKRWISSRAAGT